MTDQSVKRPSILLAASSPMTASNSEAYLRASSSTTAPPAANSRVAARPAIVIWYEARRSRRRCTLSSRVPPSTPRNSITYEPNASTLKPTAIAIQYQVASSNLPTYHITFMWPMWSQCQG
jgi:hypothetical protein